MVIPDGILSGQQVILTKQSEVKNLSTSLRFA